MKKCISIILSSVLLLSAIMVSAEENNSVQNENAEISLDVVESGLAIDTTQDNISDKTESVENKENSAESNVVDTESNETQSDLTEDGIETMNVNTDVSSDEWESISDMSSQRAECELVSVDGELYSIAGIGDSGYLNTIEKYDETNNIWQTITEIPNESKGFGVIAQESKIYIIGGYNVSGYLSTVQIYDVNTNEWNELTSMKEKRDQPAVLYMDNKIYVFGGRNVNGFVHSYEYYDFLNNTWNKVTSGFSESIIRVGAHAQFMGGYICIYGGMDENYSYAGVDMYAANDLKESQEIIEDGYEDISIAWGADKSLIFAWDRENNVYNIHEMAVIDGEVSLSDVVFKNTSSAGKYSKYVMHNGYLYVVGGYNIVSKKYLSTVNKYSVYYGNYSVGDGTINSTVTTDGNAITLNIEAGREYMLFVNVKNMSTFSGYIFTLEYPEDAFSIIDGCALTAEKNIDMGSVDGTDIVITGTSGNGLSFICTEELSGEEALTKTVNAVLLKANASGQRTITYSMTQGDE